MTITLDDVQKILGLRVSDRPVTGSCESIGWRDRVHAFLCRDLPADDGANRTARVQISWLRQSFGVCPQYADEDTVQHYCRAWILHLFGCFLFPDATGDCASWMHIPCLTDWDRTCQFSWGPAVLSFVYRQLCEACDGPPPRPLFKGCVLPTPTLDVVLDTGWTSTGVPSSTLVPWCSSSSMPYVRIHLGPGSHPIWQSKMGILGVRQRVGHTLGIQRKCSTIIKFTNNFVASNVWSSFMQVIWEPYNTPGLNDLEFSDMCRNDDDLYRMRCPLICF
jgi:hypothetical protein